MAEEKLSAVEKEKTMLELECKDITQRHKSDFNRKDVAIANVSLAGWERACYFIVFITLYTTLLNVVIASTVGRIIASGDWLRIRPRTKQNKHYQALTT